MHDGSAFPYKSAGLFLSDRISSRVRRLLINTYIFILFLPQHAATPRLFMATLRFSANFKALPVSRGLLNGTYAGSLLYTSKINSELNLASYFKLRGRMHERQHRLQTFLRNFSRRFGLIVSHYNDVCEGHTVFVLFLFLIPWMSSADMNQLNKSLAFSLPRRSVHIFPFVYRITVSLPVGHIATANFRDNAIHIKNS